jgi:RNA polymerase sigma-70 factor (ECF subfamily)
MESGLSHLVARIHYNLVMPLPSIPASGNGGFASTQWSVVLAARDGATSEAQAAMATLCANYWRPLYAYVRRSGRSIEDAQDLTQSFFLHLLERNGLRHVEPTRGKFRAFLLACLNNFLTNQWRRENAGKRGGAVRFLSAADLSRAEEHYASGLATPESPERVYERNWALALLQRTMERLTEEFAAAGKSHVFEALKPRLTGDGDGAAYAELSAALGMSEVGVRVTVHRMRGRFRGLLRQDVAQTLVDAGDARASEEEMRYLLTVL